MKFQTVAAAAALVGAATATLPPIEITGNAFYPKGSSERFYLRGVDYQPGGSSNVTDPLADPATCQRDVPYFKQLGVNIIRVYTVDNSANHDECMQALDDAGIYLLLDVNTPRQSINRADPAPSYNAAYLQHVFATIDAFKNYTNTFGFFAANEVINSENTTDTAPYIKAVVRDMKSYISKQCDRTIPVGYSAADIADNRWYQMEYFNCGDESERIDMFGMNDYSWCGTASSFQISGWAANVQNYGNYSIPMFLSEYGCNTVSPRTFPEVAALYSTEMSSVYSGGLVYEYSQEANNYGLVQINGNSVSELPDYTNFKSALAAAPDPTGSAGATTTRVPATCPGYVKGEWDISNDDLPATPSQAVEYIQNGAGTPLGFNGPDTQWLGNSSPSGSSAAGSGSSATTSSSSSAASSSHSKSAAGYVAPPSVSKLAVGCATFVFASIMAGAALL
jgi:hypothetical protein